MELQHILCPVDFSRATPAGLGVAQSLARHCGARITLLHVLPALQMPFRIPVDTDELYEQWDKEAQGRLEELAITLRAEGIAAQSRLAAGAAYYQIADLAEELEADLVTLPTHSRKGMNRLLYGSVSERVVRACPTPVMTVPPEEDIAEFSPERILVATDFSRGAEAALGAGMELASSFGSSLVLAHVFTFEHFSDEGTEWWRPTLTKEQVQNAVQASTERLESLAERVRGASIDVEVDLSQGANPAAELVRLAEEEEVDLVVAGTRGAGLLKHLLLGSTAEKLVRSCPVPLWIQPALEEEAAGSTLPDPVPA